MTADPGSLLNVVSTFVRDVAKKLKSGCRDVELLVIVDRSNVN
jgi:hypothetical protein